MMAKETRALERGNRPPRGGVAGGERQRLAAKRGAFTLIELLVVIAIIALLLAVLMPAMSRARKQAKAMVCQSRLRQWGTILALYAQDNEGHFPCSLDGNAGMWLLCGTLLPAASKDPKATQDSLYHFRTKSIACCPLATRGSDGEFPLALPLTASYPASFDFASPYVLLGNEDAGHPAWVMCKPAPRFIGSYGLNQFLFRPHFQSTLTFVPQAGWRCRGGRFLPPEQGEHPDHPGFLVAWEGPLPRASRPLDLSRPSPLALLRDSPRRFRERRLLGLVRAEDRPERVVEAQMVRGLRHEWALDLGRGRETRPMACVDAGYERLLRVRADASLRG